MGELRERYGDITVPTLEQIIDEVMSSKSVQPRILIGETTGEHDITETTRQLMTRLLTAVSIPVYIPYSANFDEEKHLQNFDKLIVGCKGEKLRNNVLTKI